ncbi:MAG: hypothetical protein ABIM30_00365 [candidate division WOR-3 bacterium]
MDKIAFFYELGYNMVKEAEEGEFSKKHPVLSTIGKGGLLGALLGAGLGGIPAGLKGGTRGLLAGALTGGGLGGILGAALGLPIGTGKALARKQMEEIPAYLLGGNPLITYLAKEIYKPKTLKEKLFG